MEFEDVSAEVEWEARRHAIAFDLPKWDTIDFDWKEGRRFCLRAQIEGLWIECWYGFDEEKNDWGLMIDDYGGGLYTQDDLIVEIEVVCGQVTCDSYIPVSKKNKAHQVSTRLLKAAFLLGYRQHRS